jgi:Na+/H+ antiporter NhaD/arsenite permease-like protein
MRAILTWIVLVILGCIVVFALGGVGPIELLVIALVAAAITWLLKRRSAARAQTL